MKAAAAGLLAALALLSGCGTKATDYPLAAGKANPTQTPIDANPDHPFVLMTFSGGGSRAAALAASVVERLNNLHYTVGGETRALSADITAVSSVSGGSVYAVDLGLNGPGHAASFMHRIQDFDGLGWLARRFLNPLTWLTLQFEDQTRVAVQQQMIEDLLQTKATMAALNQPGRHLTLLNATDMVAGQVFTFDRQTLDDVCMDYDKVPVSLAVNASADVPFAFTPVLLHNDSYLLPNCPGQRNPGLPYLTTLQSPGGPYANLEAYRTARYRQSLRNEVVVEQGTGDKVPPYRKPVYLRLVDGGVADNSGLTALRRAMSTLAPADIGRLAAQGKLRRIVVVAVNAGVDPPNDLDHSTRYTTLLDMADGITNTLLNSASANSAAVFQDFIKLLINDRDALVLQDGQTQANFAVYPISIDFDQLPNATEAERQQLQKVKSIATSWTLKSGDVALLDQVAGELLWRHPCFRLLVSDIRLQGKPEAGPIPGLRCPVEPPVPISQRGKPRPA